MAFHFRLRKLLEHRKHLVRQAQIELAQALAEVQGIKDRMSVTAQRVQHVQALLSEKQSHGVSVAEFLSFQDHLSGLEQQLLTLKRQLKQAQRKAEARRKALVAKEREAKKLEKLEEIDHERFRIEEKKREQKFLDESGRTRLGREPARFGDEDP